jgi:cation diffusion facilitator CzcD-associated flavoprotein CzcO
MNTNHIDIIIIGGLSGIGAACHLSRKIDKTYIILEARTEVGGTWIYLNTLVFVLTLICILLAILLKHGMSKVFRWRTFYFKIYKPLTNTRCEITLSINSNALCYNFDTKIMDDNYWNTSTAEETIYTCQFIFSCSGYYNYTKGIPQFTDQSSLKEK